MTELKPPIIIKLGNGTGGTFPSMVNGAISTAIGDGITNAQPQLQADIDYCILNGITDLFLPQSVYKINWPLLIYKNNTSGGYTQATLKLWGRSSMWDSFAATVIVLNYPDKFGLGIQQGKGCTVEGIRFAGKYIPGTVDDRTFYSRTLAQTDDAICRNTRYSPHAGIVIDPFTNGQMPPDGGYPGMSSYYKGNGGNAGSTGITINKCTFNNFPVGIVTSPNGSTQNAEILSFTNVQFAFCPLWVGGSQAQEKENRIINAAGWADTHTCFATGIYGAEQPGHWFIDGVNVAGRCSQLISNYQGGWFPTNITNVFAEGLGRIGYLGGDTASHVSNSVFDFAYPDVVGYKEVIGGGNVRFTGCNFRHYGMTTMLPIMTSHCTFDHCSFTGTPLQTYEGNNPGWGSQFIDCTVNGKRFGMTGIKDGYIGYGLHAYGRFILEDYNLDTIGIRMRVESNNVEPYARIFTDNNVSITVSNYSFTFNSSKPLLYSIGTMVIIQLSGGGGAHYFGVVSAVTGSSVTVSNCTTELTSGTAAYISVAYPFYLTSFLGDITNGSNVITNVISGWGGAPPVGTVFLSSPPYSSSRWLKVISTTGNTITVSENMTQTKIGVYFNSNCRQEIGYDVANAPVNSIGVTLVGKGDIIKMGNNFDNATHYRVTQSGLAALPAGETRQATWAQITP